jgi:hypothetical protein
MLLATISVAEGQSKKRLFFAIGICADWHNILFFDNIYFLLISFFC